ncbi:MAG: TrkH family potassium uptake protein [Gemmatimonadota bacterium]
MSGLHDVFGATEMTPRRRMTTVQVFVASFAGLIALGTAGFLLLPGLYTGPPLGIVDALFTATSAVCVTGLIVVDTATYFTPLGQAWILFLIQAGGLGILTLTTLVLLSFGRRSLSMEGAQTGGAPPTVHFLDEKRLIQVVVASTFALEFVGAVLLWGQWRAHFGALGAVWPSIFHSVSAFCNAGFSTFSDSLVPFRDAPWTLAVVAGLIILGGMGFMVLADLSRRVRSNRHQLSLHSRLVLTTTGMLLFAGTLLYLAFEWSNDLNGLSAVDRVFNAFFMSVTPRTAGFNTVDYAVATNATVFLTILLMVIGGSPGSTAGGLKTTTFTLLFLIFIARLRGDREVHAFHRTIPRETLQRAVGLVAGGLAFIALAVFVLMVTESRPGDIADRAHFLQLVFEAHSAFGTVGLSMGITPDLTPAGRMVMVVLMFAGRVGPLALVAAMAHAGQRRHMAFRYGQEDVSVG